MQARLGPKKTGSKSDWSIGDAWQYRIDCWRMVMHGPVMARKKISTTVYITPEQDERLKLLHQKTKVPVAEYIRQGIDLVLDREKSHLPGQLSLDVVRR